MRQAAPEVQELAQRLLAHDARAGPPFQSLGSQTLAEAAQSATDKLRLRLSPIFGLAGFQALLVRALVLAKLRYPWLIALQVRADGSLLGLREAAAGQDPACLREGIVDLMAQLLGLLIAFIGETMTLRLLRDVWPEVSLWDWPGPGGTISSLEEQP